MARKRPARFCKHCRKYLDATNKRDTCNRDCAGASLHVHPDSVPVANTIKRELGRADKSIEAIETYGRINIKYAHPDDKMQLEQRLAIALEYVIAMRAAKPIEATNEPLLLGIQQAPVEPENEAIEPVVEAAPLLKRSPTTMKTDPHLFRAAREVGKISGYAEFGIMRGYFIMRNLDSQRRETEGQDARNWVTKQEFRAFLKDNGLYDRKTFNRMINEGHELGYWTFHKPKQRIHYRGYKSLCKWMISRLPEHRLEAYRGNQGFGGRMVWVDLSGTNQQLKGHILGAWMAQRERGHGVTMAIPTIAEMWDVSERTIYNWLDASDGAISRVANYADVETKPRRLPNTYIAVEANTHNKTGQSRKARQATYEEMSLLSDDSLSDVVYAEKRYFQAKSVGKALTAITRYNRKNQLIDPPPQYALIEHKLYSGVSYGLWGTAVC